MLEQMGAASQSAAKSLHVKSALNPMLWLTGITTPVCFAGAYLLKDFNFISQALAVTGLLPTVVTCLGFMYFAVFKAEKLQSEDYQIRHESLQIIQQKSGTIEVPLSSLENIVNPRNNIPNNKGDK